MDVANGEKAELHALIDRVWKATASARRSELCSYMRVAIRTWQESDVPNIGPEPD